MKCRNTLLLIAGLLLGSAIAAALDLGNEPIRNEPSNVYQLEEQQ